MSFEERNTWVYLVVSVFSYGVYLASILGRWHGVPLTEVPYVATMLWMIGAAIVSAIVLIILLSIAAGIVSPKESSKKDQRDREIHRYGEYIGQSLMGIGVMAVLGMSMAKFNHFWISNGIYLTFVLSAIVGSVVKIVAYRRGF